jgi:hypothetical protein
VDLARGARHRVPGLIAATVTLIRSRTRAISGHGVYSTYAGKTPPRRTGGDRMAQFEKTSRRARRFRARRGLPLVDFGRAADVCGAALARSAHRIVVDKKRIAGHLRRTGASLDVGPARRHHAGRRATAQRLHDSPIPSAFSAHGRRWIAERGRGVNAPACTARSWTWWPRDRVRVGTATSSPSAGVHTTSIWFPLSGSAAKELWRDFTRATLRCTRTTRRAFAAFGLRHRNTAGTRWRIVPERPASPYPDFYDPIDSVMLKQARSNRSE